MSLLEEILEHVRKYRAVAMEYVDPVDSLLNSECGHYVAGQMMDGLFVKETVVMDVDPERVFQKLFAKLQEVRA
jgi:hypothetical protein